MRKPAILTTCLRSLKKCLAKPAAKTKGDQRAALDTEKRFSRIDAERLPGLPPLNNKRLGAPFLMAWVLEKPHVED
jgi:hypothetical protein